MEKINEELIEFINKTPNAYCCIDNLKKVLNQEGYQEKSNEVLSSSNEKGKYYFTKGDSSLIAFKIPEERNGFNIVATHTDSPSFSVKVNPEMYENGYLKLNVEGYGAMINYTWLDRPLSIAGRVVYQEKGIYKTKTINFDKDLLVIPSQAIHINREINEKATFNHQIDMIPIIAFQDKSLKDMISDQLVEEGIYNFDKICDYDLYLYNRDQAKICGADDEFILSPRLDDLACLYPAFRSFLDSENNATISVFCAFNNEEIGSLTKQGADSNFLLDTLSKITGNINCNELYKLFANSFVVSADNAHAIHPNAASKSDPTNKVELNKGIVIKHHINYTTDALTSSIFKGVCDDSNTLYQDFTCRSDMRCGSTLGGINTSHVGIDSIDIGLAQLAMHSANELMGVKDPNYLYQALKEFYQTSFIRENNSIRVVKQKRK